jgi:hypothetical protein
MSTSKCDVKRATIVGMINRRSISTLTAAGVLALGVTGAAEARHGADDPIGHNAGDDHGQRHGGHGADDGKGRTARHGHRHGRGRHNDDGPNHT